MIKSLILWKARSPWGEQALCQGCPSSGCQEPLTQGSVCQGQKRKAWVWETETHGSSRDALTVTASAVAGHHRLTEMTLYQHSQVTLCWQWPKICKSVEAHASFSEEIIYNPGFKEFLQIIFQCMWWLLSLSLSCLPPSFPSSLPPSLSLSDTQAWNTL